MSTEHYTFCHICGHCCGLAVTVDDGRIVEIRPDKQNPYTWRDFCAKGAKAHLSIYHPRRIMTPMRRVGDRYEAATYEEAISDIAARLKRIIEAHGPSAVGAYGGNPQFYNFAASTFMSGVLQGIGTHNWFWVGSLDTNAAHVVAEMMYGSPFMLPNMDVDPCRCFLMIGTNPAESGHGWGGHAADGWKRVLAAQAQGADLIVVDPRRTPTAARANLHISIRPGEDWAFLLGVVKVVLEKGWVHAEDCARTRGFEKVHALAASASLAELSVRCDVAVDVIQDVAYRFARAPAAHCITRTGSGQSCNGTLAEWLSNVLNVVTGRMDRPGGRVFSAGIFDYLETFGAALPQNRTVSRVRRLPSVAGAHTLAELPDEITTPGEGQIRALFIHAGNPVISGPQGQALDAALGQLELLVAIDLFQRESHRHAHWLIPGEHFLERTEFHPLLAPIHDLPFVQMSRKVVDPPAGIRSEWEFLADLALCMNVPLFGKPSFNRMLRGSRWLARVTGWSRLAFDPSWMSRTLVRQGRRVRWKDVESAPHGVFYGRKSYGSFWTELRTPHKLVELCPAPVAALLRERLAEAPRQTVPGDFPLQMISRRRTRNMNSWFVETTGREIRGFPGETVEINSGDGARLGIVNGQAVRVVSRVARLEARAALSDRIRPGVVVLEQCWGSRLFDPLGREPAECYGINRNLLVPNDELDPLSFMPLLNGTPVRLEVIAAAPPGGPPDSAQLHGRRELISNPEHPHYEQRTVHLAETSDTR